MDMGSVVLWLLIVAVLTILVMAQIRREGRSRRREQRELDREGGQEKLSHEQAKDREWWI